MGPHEGVFKISFITSFQKLSSRSTRKIKLDLNKEEIYVVMVEDLFPDLGLLSYHMTRDSGTF